MRARRVLASLAVGGVLSGGAILAGASPSSAVPRDPCVDQNTYSMIETSLMDSVNWAEEGLWAWVWAEYDEPTDTYAAQPVWADSPTTVSAWPGWGEMLEFWNDEVHYELNRLSDFYDTVWVCPY